jgi:hypothetical protein
MAAAAALAAYFVYGAEPAAPSPRFELARPAMAVTVTAAPGTGTVVLATSNPKITLVWIGQEITP